MKMNFKFLLVTMGLLIVQSTYARPIVIILEQKLSEATYIGFVVIKKYKGRKVVFYEVNNSKKSLSASSVIKMKNEYAGRAGEHYSGSWPHVNDSVLIVVDRVNEVSLFAEKRGSNYRFWSPGPFTYLFAYKSPATCLNEKQAGDQESRCWDGCLLPINELVKYKK